MERSVFGNILFYMGVALIVTVSVYPFYYAIITSFESGTALFKPNFSPESFSLENYKNVLSQRSFLRSFANSVFIAAITVGFALFLAVTASYALARVSFRGRGLLLITISETERTVPVAIALLSGASSQEVPWGAIMAASVIVTVPLIIFFLWKLERPTR